MSSGISLMKAPMRAVASTTTNRKHTAHGKSLYGRFSGIMGFSSKIAAPLRQAPSL